MVISADRRSAFIANMVTALALSSCARRDNKADFPLPGTPKRRVVVVDSDSILLVIRLNSSLSNHCPSVSVVGQFNKEFDALSNAFLYLQKSHPVV